MPEDPVRNLWTLLALTTALSLAGGCASTGGGGGGSVSGSTISSDDLEGVPWDNAYEVLANHTWLRTRDGGFVRSNRGPTSAVGGASGTMLVVIDGNQIRSGARSLLRGISVEQIGRIRILRASEATTRFGMQAGEGAIVLETKG